MWDFWKCNAQNVGYSEFDIFAIRDFWDAGYSTCGMFRMCDVWYVECSRCRMFVMCMLRMCDVQGKVWLVCGMFRM